jgi:hypothetical protein
MHLRRPHVGTPWACPTRDNPIAAIRPATGILSQAPSTEISPRFRLHCIMVYLMVYY